MPELAIATACHEGVLKLQTCHCSWCMHMHAVKRAESAAGYRPQSQLQLQLHQAAGHGIAQHTPNSSQTQMTAATTASQWPLD